MSAHRGAATLSASESRHDGAARWRFQILWLLIFLIGAGLRFTNLRLVRFNYDNAYPMYDALRMLDGRQWLLIGQPTSVGANNPILMSYIQALPLLIWRSPWAVRIFIALLNTLAIAFVYDTGRRLLGEAAGLAAALLFAINPWLVYFSLTTWVQSLLPLLLSIIAWGLFPTLTTARREPGPVLIGGLAVTVATQTYLQAMGVLAQVIPLLAIFRRRAPLRALYAGMVIFVVAMMLYGVGLWQAREGSLTKAVRLLEEEINLHWTREGWDHALRLVTGRDFESMWGQAPTARYARQRWLSLRVDLLLRLAMAMGAIFAVGEMVRGGPRRDVAMSLGLWFLIPVALTSYSAQPIHIHYLLLSCPAGHLIAAWGLRPWARHRRARWWLLPILASVALLFGLNLQLARQHVMRAPTVRAFDGWDLAASARVGATIRELTADSAPYPVRVVSDANPAVISSISAIYLDPIKNVAYPNYVVLPGQHPLLYVLVDEPVDATVLGPRRESFAEKEIVISDGTRVNFLRALPYDEAAALALPATALDWPSEAGLTLLGYTFPASARAGDTLTGVTYWRVEDTLPGSAEWFVGAFYHLIDEDGRQVINHGGRGQWGYVWQHGDIYVERVRIALPSELTPRTYTLAFGLLDPIHGRGFTFIAPDGWFPTATTLIDVEGRRE